MKIRHLEKLNDATVRFACSNRCANKTPEFSETKMAGTTVVAVVVVALTGWRRRNAESTIKRRATIATVRYGSRLNDPMRWMGYHSMPWRLFGAKVIIAIQWHQWCWWCCCWCWWIHSCRRCRLLADEFRGGCKWWMRDRDLPAKGLYGIRNREREKRAKWEVGQRREVVSVGFVVSVFQEQDFVGGFRGFRVRECNCPA